MADGEIALLPGEFEGDGATQPMSRDIEPPSKTTISHDLPFIDWVRGLASLLVLLSHAGGVVWPHAALFHFSGSLGVDCFIIVSGFLMSLTLAKKDSDLLSRARLESFYLRPFFPHRSGFYLAYLGSLFIAMSPPLDVMAHLTFLNGLFSRYSREQVIAPFWSITLEMQFYAVVPFILAAIRVAPSWITLAACGLVTWGASTLWGIYSAPGILGSFDHPTFLPLSLGLFAVGIILALHFTRSPQAPPFVISALLIASYPFQHPFYEHSAVAAMGGLVVLFALRYQKKLPPWERLVPRSARRVLGQIGKVLADYSYSLYLFHSFVAIFVSGYIMPLAGMERLPRFAAFLVVLTILLTVTYAIAYFTFRFVEMPGVRLGAWLQKRLRS